MDNGDLDLERVLKCVSPFWGHTTSHPSYLKMWNKFSTHVSVNFDVGITIDFDASLARTQLFTIQQNKDREKWFKIDDCQRFNNHVFHMPAPRFYLIRDRCEQARQAAGVDARGTGLMYKSPGNRTTSILPQHIPGVFTQF